MIVFPSALFHSFFLYTQRRSCSPPRCSNACVHIFVSVTLLQRTCAARAMMVSNLLGFRRFGSFSPPAGGASGETDRSSAEGKSASGDIASRAVDDAVRAYRAKTPARSVPMSNVEANGDDAKFRQDQMPCPVCGSFPAPHADTNGAMVAEARRQKEKQDKIITDEAREEAADAKAAKARNKMRFRIWSVGISLYLTLVRHADLFAFYFDSSFRIFSFGFVLCSL